MLLNVFAAIPLLIWGYLYFARGSFWRVSKHLPENVVSGPIPRRIIAVIPARDEATGIGAAVTSLLAQNLQVVVVDDSSTDGTADVARAAALAAGKAAHLTVLPGQPLPPGWTGKLWAVSQGIQHAMPLAPDYLLLTDADIQHGATSIAQLTAIAQAGKYDLASYMVKLACQATAEKALIPAFVYFFFKLYPPSWIASGNHATAGAAGGCMLIRTAVLQQIGGIASIRNQVIDDCALARQVKRSGGRVWLGLTDLTSSTRSYKTFSEIEKMISRTAFNQLHHSALLLTGTTLGLFFTYLLPPLLLFTGKPVPVVCGLVAWLLMTATYLPMVMFYRCSKLWSISLPAVAGFYAVATIHSAVRYWSGRGGQWKGRAQDIRAR